MDKYIGKRLDGRYEIKEVIGVGGMAMVYKAFDNIDKKTVALKILKDEFLQNEDFTRRFKNESKAIAILSHDNIVKVYDVGFGENIKYIVMEYIDGITLKEYIEKKGNLSWNEACHFTIQILEALQHAHNKGLVHRDIKPQNIMVCRDGSIKVTDFGIARFTQNGQRTITDKAIGSVHYISPEQAKGGHIDEKADIYSLGVILYEMLTGKLPFESDSAVSVAIMQLQKNPESLREIDRNIPQGLEDITLRAMQKNRELRYKSANDMLKDLKRFMENPRSRFKVDKFVDNQPTRYIDKIEEYEEEYDDDEYYEEDNRKTKIIGAIAISLFLTVVVFAALIFLKVDSGTGQISCPDLLGKNYYSDIKTAPELNKLNIVIEKQEYGEEENGTILEQSIAPGKMIKTTNEILVTISRGSKTVEIPDVSDYNRSMAKTMLESKGLVVELSEKYDEEVQSDMAIETKPEQGEKVANGSKVILYVSLGPPNSYVKMPYLMDLKESDAKLRITECELTVGTITQAASSKPAGVVISQSTDPNTEIASGTAINFVVSTGQAEVKKGSVTIELPNEDRIVVVNLYQDGESVYESSRLKLSTKGSITIPIEGKGVSKFSVTFTGGKLDQFEYMTFTYDFTTSKQSDVVKNTIPSDTTVPLTTKTTTPTVTLPTTMLPTTTQQDTDE